MKNLTIIGSAILLASGAQLAAAQPPGGGGGGARGAFGGMTFDAINTETEESPDHLTVEEVTAFFEEMFAQFAGRGGGGGGGGAAGGRGGFDPAAIFASWDTDPEGGDGRVTREEFDNRPQGGGRGGRGGRGGGAGAPGGAPGGAQQ